MKTGLVNKISHDISEKIYDTLVKLCEVKNDYYERETFVYHFSMVECKDKIYEIETKNGTLVVDLFSDYDNYVYLKGDGVLENIELCNKIILRYLHNICLF